VGLVLARLVCWGASAGTTLALARVAAGGARWGRTATRSGAERADGPAVLAAGAHRATHCARFARSVRTSAMRMMTKCAARTAPAAALLGAPPNAPPPGTACRDAREQCAGRSTFGTRADRQPRSARAVRAKHATPTRSSSPQACGGRVRRACGAARRRAPDTNSPVDCLCLASGRATGPARPAGPGLAASAKRVRQHFHCACLNGAAEGRAVSCAMGRKTEHRSAVGAFSARPPHRSAAPGPHRPGVTQLKTAPGPHRPGATQLKKTNHRPGATQLKTNHARDLRHVRQPVPVPARPGSRPAVPAASGSRGTSGRGH